MLTSMLGIIAFENLKSNSTNSKTLLPHKSKKTAFNFLTERRPSPPAMHV